MTRLTTGWLTRPAVPADATAVGSLHVRSWRLGYRGLLPDELLAGLDPREASARWHEWLTEPGRAAMFAAFRRHPSGAERIGAFSAVGPVRGDPGEGRAPGQWGELYALYADPDAYRTGAGYVAHQAGLSHLASGGLLGAVLWVMVRNVVARAFYARQGWCCDQVTGEHEMRGTPLEVVRYSRGLASP